MTTHPCRKILIPKLNSGERRWISLERRSNFSPASHLGSPVDVTCAPALIINPNILIPLPTARRKPNDAGCIENGRPIAAAPC